MDAGERLLTAVADRVNARLTAVVDDTGSASDFKFIAPEESFDEPIVAIRFKVESRVFDMRFDFDSTMGDIEAETATVLAVKDKETIEIVAMLIGVSASVMLIDPGPFTTKLKSSAVRVLAERSEGVNERVSSG